MDLVYGLFMADMENRFPDARKSSIDAAINDLILYHRVGCNLNSVINDVLNCYNLTNISNKECEYIKKTVLNYI